MTTQKALLALTEHADKIAVHVGHTITYVKEVGGVEYTGILERISTHVDLHCVWLWVRLEGTPWPLRVGINQVKHCSCEVKRQ